MFCVSRLDVFHYFEPSCVSFVFQFCVSAPLAEWLNSAPLAEWLNRAAAADQPPAAAVARASVALADQQSGE